MKIENLKWFQKKQGIILLLILFFPIGLYLMWKHSDWNKKTKVIVTSIFLIGAIFSKTDNYSPLFNEYVQIIEQKKPLKPVESMMVNNDTPEDISLHNKDSSGKFKSMTTVGSNWSGNLSGPSEVKISFDKEKELIIIKTKNTTGSIYTRYDTWEDTFYLSFNEKTWVYEKTSDDGIKYYGIGFKENPTSLKGTTGCIGNIKVYENSPNSITVMVFGSGSSKWQIQSKFYFEEKSLIDDFQKLKSMIESSKQ